MELAQVLLDLVIETGHYSWKIYNCQIDLSIVKRTAGSIDKLVLYNVEQTANCTTL